MDTILVVDDEEDIADLVIFHLEKNGYRGQKLTNGLPVVQTARDIQPAAIILDLMLPGVPGLEVFRRLRAQNDTKHIPVIMLTAKAEEVDRIVGFELGADDYVTKPFSARELMLRLKAVLRRHGTPQEKPKIYKGGPISLDAESFVVRIDNESVTLTATEFGLLEELMSRKGRVLSRELLLNNVWGYTHSGSLRTVDTHVRRLRAKLGDAAWYVETIRSVGYRFRDDNAVRGEDDELEPASAVDGDDADDDAAEDV